MTEPPIEAALEQVRHGAVDEYALVVQTYQRRLRAWLASVCPPQLEPDEIAHRAFIEAYKQVDRYQPGTNFFAWLSVIARNLLLAELKRLQRQQKNAANYLEHVVVSGLIAAAEEPLETQEERLSALRACQELLSERSRSLLRERYTLNTPLEAVAHQFGKTVAAVKFQLFAIRQKLRECVRRRLREDGLTLPPLGQTELS
jgi:RNA polymerase sigma-70 factor (ECF subfamily)